MRTLLDIQVQIASEIDGNATIATTSTDWFNRLAPINRALFDWQNTYDWKELKKTYNGFVSTSTGNSSIVLPSDFRKMDGFPKVAIDSYNDGLPIVDIAQNDRFGSTDRFANILGNENGGRVMVVHGATLPSGASVSFSYWSSALSLSSVGQITECPDPTYIAQRALYYLHKSAEDGRFPESKAEADRIMARMIENENALGSGFVDRRVGSSQYTNFRIGRD